MALECKKTSGAGLVVSKLPPHNDNDHQAPVTTMINGRDHEIVASPSKRKTQADVDIKEVYFLIMHFLSEGPCQRASAQLKDELEQYGLLPQRYHAWYSRSGTCSGENEDNGLSVPLSYSQLLERFSFIEQNHLVRLLEELFSRTAALHSISDAKNPTAADASTLLGTGSVSLLNIDRGGTQQAKCSRNLAGQVYGLTLREVGGGLARHHRAPAIRAASYQIVKPSVLVSRIQKIKTFRGHRNAVYCAIFDKSGEYIITGSDDRLVKIWSTATGFCLCSCRGHEGDITDLAVSANNLLLASASNDCFIRVWRFPDGYPLSVLKGHTSAVTAIAFSPRQGCEYLLLSASDDGTCRIWDARDSSRNARIYAPKLEGQESGAKISESGQPNMQPRTQILCCAFNASGTVFVTGSADKLARVWDACKWTDEIHGGPYNEFDTLKGHEDDVNYVQFSGCASPSRPVNVDSRPVNFGVPAKNERFSRFRNSWFGYESIVSCSRDGSAIIWVPRPRKYHGKSKWMKGYHLRVPPPPMPPQPPRGVPRQRLLPTPRGVNMIVWSLDNRYVLAAIMDCRICVWNAVDGGLVHSLTGHTKSTFVLDVHPHDPRIAMSAGYDGRVIIWDIWEGRTIHEYNIGDFHLVDGKFSPDGTSIVISDEVGQIYLLATGEGRSQKDAKYDQFFLGDYRPLARDVHGNVLDQETQITPHARNMRDLLCDANMIPYAEPYQSMYQQRRLGAIGINWHPPPAQWVAGSLDDSSYLTVGFPLLPLPDEDDSVHEAHQAGTRWVEQPFDEEAMEWEQDSVDDAGSDYTLSFENACEDDERDCSLTSSEDHSESFDEEDSSEEDELSQRARLRRSERNKKKEEEVATSGRSTKRKHRDGGKDYSLRRSKRHKKNKRLSRKLSLRRGSDGEQSKGRPRRLAAKNARLFFSRIGAEEDEHSDSETSQDVESAGEEQQSSRQSHEKEDGDKHDLENTEEGSTAEAEPSDVQWSRPTRSNPSGKLRISTRKAPRAQASAEVAGADAFSAEDIPEEQVYTSLANTSMDSTCQRETLWDDQANSTAISNRGEKSDIMLGTSDPELDAVSPLSGKRKWIVSSSNANKSPRVEFFREEPSQDELLINQTGNIHVPNKESEEGLQSPHVSLQPTNVPGTCLHTVKNGDGFGFASESLKQRESSLDGYETEIHENESFHKVSEKTILYEKNVSVQEFNDDAELSNQSCHVSELPIGDVEEQSLKGQEYVGSSVHEDGRALKETKSSMRLDVAEPLLFQDASLEHDENDTIEDKQMEAHQLKFNNDSAVDHLAEEKGDGCQLADPLAVAIIGEEYYTNEKAEFVEEACLNASNKSLSAQGKPIKVILGSLRKHQPMGTSWKHNSPTCLWLRQDTDEARDAGPSSSEVESANGENMAEGIAQHHESGQAHNLKLTFRRGKRRALKQRKRVDFKPDSPAAVEVKDMPEPSPQEFEGKLDEDEFMGKMKVTLTYVRTRRHGKSVEDKESSKGSDTGLRIERREGLRFSIRSKSNTEDGDQGKNAEEFSRKGKKNNKVSWLMLTKVEDGTRYIPQLGDEVAYVLQGQDEFPKLSRLEDKGAPKGLRSQLGAVELCEVVSIEYKNLSGFSGVSCNLTLRLIGEGCEALGRTFRLSLPELTDFPDFLIDRSRYEASLRRNWTKRDRCKVWWRLNMVDENGEEKTGQWFFGRVVAVETKSSQFPGSPWDACVVQYIGDSTGPHRHSPWELFDVDSIEIVPSHMNEATRIQILSTIEDIEASCASSQDEYGLRALRTLLRKQDFLNKTLVPLGLDTIKDRLKNKYYRSLDAFQYDIQLLATNVQDYLCDDELTFQVQNLADRLLKEG